MSSEISVRDQIFSTYGSLYDAEKKVADYLISHPAEAIEMSVSELAKHCEASQATIVRFCKKIGCKGFHQLKIKMAGEQRPQEEQVISQRDQPGPYGAVAEQHFGKQAGRIKGGHTPNFDPKELREIIDLILQGGYDRICRHGQYNSYCAGWNL